MCRNNNSNIIFLPSSDYDYKTNILSFGECYQHLRHTYKRYMSLSNISHVEINEGALIIPYVYKAKNIYYVSNDIAFMVDKLTRNIYYYRLLLCLSIIATIFYMKYGACKSKSINKKVG